MTEKTAPKIAAIGFDDTDLTVTFTDGDKGTYSPKELIELAASNDTLECTRAESSETTQS